MVRSIDCAKSVSDERKSLISNPDFTLRANPTLTAPISTITGMAMIRRAASPETATPTALMPCAAPAISGRIGFPLSAARRLRRFVAMAGTTATTTTRAATAPVPIDGMTAASATARPPRTATTTCPNRYKGLVHHRVGLGPT